MPRSSIRLAALLATVTFAPAARGQQPLQPAVADTTSPPAAVIPLWPNGAPGAVGDSSVDRPTLAVYPPPAGRATGAAGIVFPGGGYSHIATGKEGVLSARWLAPLGVTTFVVQYRLGPRYHHPAMLQDGLRAVRTVRARAAEWHLDPSRIAVLGYSAGGHLASTVGTHWADSVSDARPGRDAIDAVSARPDLMLLVYPVVTMDSALTHRGSRRNLIGDSASAALVRLMSNETQVTPRTPPTLLVASTDDATVPVENTIRLYQALRDAKVPVELHVFETGRHGFGTAVGDPYLSQWLRLATTWLQRRGWIAPTAP
jgi:acetyl esterase/lipase